MPINKITNNQRMSDVRTKVINPLIDEHNLNMTGVASNTTAIVDIRNKATKLSKKVATNTASFVTATNRIQAEETARAEADATIDYKVEAFRSHIIANTAGIGNCNNRWSVTQNAITRNISKDDAQKTITFQTLSNEDVVLDLSHMINAVSPVGNAFIIVDNINTLNETHPAADSNHKVAILTDNESFYFSDGRQWSEYAHVGATGQLKEILDRFPAQVTGAGTYDDAAQRKLGYTYIDKAHCPLSVAKEDGVVHNIYHNPTMHIQMFYGLETGNIWKRIHDIGVDWKSWVQIHGLRDSYHAVLTTINDQTFDGFHLGTNPLQYQVVADPQSNLKINTDYGIAVREEGTYDVTVGLQLTGQNDWPGAVGTFEFHIKDAAGLDIVDAITGKVSAGGTGEFHGKYPLIVAKFVGVNISEQWDTFKLYVKATQTSGNIAASFLDPYKNYVVVEPTSSVAKTGMNIANTYRNTLGGLSFHTGYEVRVERTADVTAAPRVYGERYNHNEETPREIVL